MKKYIWVMRDKIKTYPSEMPEIMNNEGLKQLCSAVLMQAIKDNSKEFFELKENIYCDYLDITEDMENFEIAYSNYMKSKEARKPNKSTEARKKMASVLQKKIEIEVGNNIQICDIAKKYNISVQRVYYYVKKIRKEKNGTN